MHSIYIFILAGAFAMSGALSAKELVSQAIPTENTLSHNTSTHTSNNTLAWYYLLSGNLAVVALVMTMVYGWQSFAWWISVACLVVSFPALHYILLQRFLAAKIRVIMYPAFAWVMLVPIVMHWLS